MNYYDEERMVFTILGVVIVLLGIVCFWAISSDNKAVSERNYKCEKAGGVLLDHTYRVGKVTNHNYVCIDPSVVKDID